MKNYFRINYQNKNAKEFGKLIYFDVNEQTNLFNTIKKSAETVGDPFCRYIERYEIQILEEKDSFGEELTLKIIKTIPFKELITL